MGHPRVLGGPSGGPIGGDDVVEVGRLRVGERVELVERVDCEAVDTEESDPVAVAGVVLDPASGPGNAGDVALGPQKLVTGDTAVFWYAQGDRHAVGQEHQSTPRPEEPGGLGKPHVRLAPRGRAVLTDNEVESSAAQRDVANVGFQQWKHDVVAMLTSARRVKLGGAQVNRDGVCSGARQARRQERGAAAEFDDLKATYVAEEPEVCFGQTKQSPPDSQRRPLVVGSGVGEPLVHERPKLAVPSKIASYLVHAAIVAQTAPVASTRVHVHRRRTRYHRAVRIHTTRPKPVE